MTTNPLLTAPNAMDAPPPSPPPPPPAVPPPPQPQQQHSDDKAAAASLTTPCPHCGQCSSSSNEALQRQINAIIHNTGVRAYNSASRLSSHQLEPLMAEQGPNAGQLPPQGLFPATPLDFYELMNAGELDGLLDKLEAFYGRAFSGKDVGWRHFWFRLFAGIAN